MYQLEKGSKKFTCPNCGVARKFKRYVNTTTGKYASEIYGRCDREENCGYSRFPLVHSKQSRHNLLQDSNNKHKVIPREKILPLKLDFIPVELFKQTLANYDKNDFVKFLFNLFPDCLEEIQDVLKMYFIGTYEDYTCFPQIDRLNRICKAKLIRFNQITGKRLKGEYDISSLVRKLKLKEDFQYKQIFFGEHLLKKFPNKPIAIVEAEKTAIIASLCFSEFLWLATGSKSWLKAERLGQLKQRKITLYPDTDGFREWKCIADKALKTGLTVKVSEVIEYKATDEEKAAQVDLADYLISKQRQISKHNSFVDNYNSAVDCVLKDINLMNEFNRIFDSKTINPMVTNEQSKNDIVRDIVLMITKQDQYDSTSVSKRYLK